MDSSAVLVEAIEDAGVEYVFGLPGSVIMNTIDKLYDAEVAFISARHEQVATTMADGYARVTGRPGISLAHVGPGAANQIIGVAAAYRDASPVIAIAGNEDRPRLGRGVWHEWDVLDVFDSFTKSATRLERGDDAARVIREALVGSVAGRPGPIFLDLPKDVSREASSYPEADRAFYDNHDLRVPFERPGVDRGRVHETVALIEAADRPLLLAGGGCVWSGAGGALREVAERLGVPVVTSPSGRGILPETHPLAWGLIGTRGTDVANEAAGRADLVLGVGARFSALTTDNWRLPAEGAALVQVDVDPREFARQFPVDVTVQADARSYLTALAAAVDDGSGDWPDDEVAETTQAVEDEIAAFFDYPETDEIGPRQFFATIQEEKDDDAIVTQGGGVHSTFNTYQRATDPLSHLHTISFGGMGYGFPLAMGAKLGAPDRQVICVEGDGGFAMVLQDLETAVRYGIDVSVIIYNNFSHGTQKLRQARLFDERYLGTDVDNPPFDELAEVFGAHGARAEAPEELRGAIRETLDHEGPSVLDVVVDPWEWPGTDMIAQI